MPLVDVKRVPEGLRAEFGEQIDPKTAVPESFVILQRWGAPEYPELHDAQKELPVVSVQVADNLKSVLLVADLPEKDVEGRKATFALYCPGVRPLKPAPPVPVGKAGAQQPVVVHVHLPEQQPPVVNVAAPNVSVSPTLSVPPRVSRTHVARDERTGRISSTETEEKDAE